MSSLSSEDTGRGDFSEAYKVTGEDGGHKDCEVVNDLHYDEDDVVSREDESDSEVYRGTHFCLNCSVGEWVGGQIIG